MGDMSAAAQPQQSLLCRRLRRELAGEVLFDPFSRGLYSTDASIYQIHPIGVVIPRTEQDVSTTMEIAREESTPVLPRGGGTSQCGQTVGKALIVDFSKHLDQVLEFESERRTITVQPGLVLDDLNRYVSPSGLFFPVDISTGNRATIGGMTGNNSCGARSVRYGNMVHNVRAIDAVLADGTELKFSEVQGNLQAIDHARRYADIVQALRALHTSEAEEIARRFPTLLRRVGGYNIDSLSSTNHNMAHMLVGSEGTLAAFQRIQLDLQPIPEHAVLGVCHFRSLHEAMGSTRHIAKLEPTAVELVDRTMLELARDIAMYRPTVEKFIHREPEAVLLVEFAGNDRSEQLRKLRELVELLSDLGFPKAVVEITDQDSQKSIWEVRKAGLNIMMSMKGDGKPISFIEDCAVPLENLAEYTDRLTQVFTKYGTTGTWYAHASVGCLHVRPILNMKTEEDVGKMRAIAEEAFAIVREYKGSHSGEHGDGLVRSEFHDVMYGPRIVKAFEKVKHIFDPQGLLNPGKIVSPQRMDDRSLFRFKPDYRPQQLDTALDWSPWSNFAGAIEMCNNNGACRKSKPGVMCPSYRATRDEKHSTRGRANSLRLAITGQLGARAFESDEMYATMDLCIGCKGCKRECPTGVDMARMKIEFLHQYRKRHGLRTKDRLIAYLPRYAPFAARIAPIMNLRDRIPGLAQASERLLGFSAERSLPRWHSDFFQTNEIKDRIPDKSAAGEVVLLPDTFNTYFEPENIRAAGRVLRAAGYDLQIPKPPEAARPLCCGRTFLAVGMVDEARAEAQRLVSTLTPFVRRGVPVVGLEPSCLFTLQDELVGMLPGEDSERVASHATTFEQFLCREQSAGRLKLTLGQTQHSSALVHGHCHQKAFNAMQSVEQALRLVPGLEVEMIESSCCGMAGVFGYEAEHYEISMKIGGLDLFPKVTAADDGTLIVADGTSCRQQIRDGAQRRAVHVACVLESALA